MAYLFIDKAGVEIEGGWDSRPENYTGDGSVHCSGDITGESVSPPYRRLSTLEKYIGNNWPQYVDESCGYHIHCSIIHNKAYSRLMEKDFHADALGFWQSWALSENISSGHRFWKRFNGSNSFCKTREDIPAQQQALARGKSGPRYFFLNFSHTAHNTMELRLLPAWIKKETAIRSLAAWLQFVDSWLSNASLDYCITEKLHGETLEPISVSEDYFVKESDKSGYLSLVVGDEVICNGVIDGREFHHQRGVVVSIADMDSPDDYQIKVKYIDPDSGVFYWYGRGSENCALRKA